MSEVEEKVEDAEFSESKAAPSMSEQDQLLLKYKVHLDRSLKLMPLVSANGLRRLFVAYLKAGVEDIPKLKKEEERILNEIMQLHDVKYSLILHAIEESSKQVEQEEKKEGEESNG